MLLPQSLEHHWTAYLTYQAYYILTIYQILSIVNILTNKHTNTVHVSYDVDVDVDILPIDKRENPKPIKLPLNLKLQWLLYNILIPHAIVITLIYYIVIYPMKISFAPRTSVFILRDINFHGINSVFVILDMAICAIPLRILHCFHCLILEILYIVFTLIFWNFDTKTNILYGVVLDWNTPGLAVGACIAYMFVLCTVWLILVGFYKLRVKIANWCERRRADGARDNGLDSQ